MKKSVIILFALLCTVVLQAQNYGILVNGKIYFAGSKVDEFEGFQQYLAHVQVKSGPVTTVSCTTQTIKHRGL